MMKTMKKIKGCLLLAGVLALAFVSCRKDTNGVFSGKGAPVISSIRTVSKTVNDTTPKTVITYDSTGVASSVTNPNTTVVISAFDSTTVTGKLGNTYAIIGQNLGSTTAIYINNVSVYFNRALSSDNTVIFTLPTTIPYVQPQSNTIKLTTLYGSVTYKFTTLPPPPTVESVSDMFFSANSQLTLHGLGFASITSVTLKTGGANITIVSQSDTVLVLKMPSTSISRSILSFAYTSGTETLHAGSPQEFVDLDNAYVIFDDSFENGWYANSWGTTTPSTSVFKTGTASIASIYPKGNWWADGYGSNAPFNTSGYTYLAFWVKGGVQDETLYLTADTRGGFANSDTGTPLTVPANVWTFVEMPLAKLNLNGTEHFGFWIMGPNGTDETFYFDDVCFIK